MFGQGWLWLLYFLSSVHLVQLDFNLDVNFTSQIILKILVIFFKPVKFAINVEVVELKNISEGHRLIFFRRNLF